MTAPDRRAALIALRDKWRGIANARRQNINPDKPMTTPQADLWMSADELDRRARELDAILQAVPSQDPPGPSPDRPCRAWENDRKAEP